MRNARGEETSIELIGKAERETTRDAQEQLLKNAARAATRICDDDSVGF
jgi:hypothetical protein